MARSLSLSNTILGTIYSPETWQHHEISLSYYFGSVVGSVEAVQMPLFHARHHSIITRSHLHSSTKRLHWILVHCKQFCHIQNIEVTRMRDCGMKEQYFYSQYVPRLLKCDSWFGTDPVKRFQCKKSNSNPLSFERCMGICPSKWFSPKSSTTSLDK
jgi:hypothetical protein